MNVPDFAADWLADDAEIDELVDVIWVALDHGDDELVVLASDALRLRIIRLRAADQAARS